MIAFDQDSPFFRNQFVIFGLPTDLILLARQLLFQLTAEIVLDNHRPTVSKARHNFSIMLECKLLQ